MNTTISAAIPDDLKEEAQHAVAAGVFPSLSHIVRIGIRQVLPRRKNRSKKFNVYDVSPEFERQIRKAQKEPLDQAIEWDGKGSFTEFVLKHAP